MVYRIRDRVVFSNTATAETTLYVDPVAGNDGYDGTISTPLATVQEAVYRFIPPYAPAPYWARFDDKTIVVVYTPGMPALTEKVHIPLSLGEGMLTIKGEEELIYTLNQSSVPAAVDGYRSLYQIGFATSPMTPGELDKSAFITPTDTTALTVSKIADDFSIYHNEDGYLWFVSPTPYFGFAGYVGQSYVDTAQFNIVRPQVAWYVGGNDGYTNPTGSIFTVDGGHVFVEGFRFEGETTNYGRNCSQIFKYNGRGISNPNGLGLNYPGNSGLARCIIYDAPTAFLNGSGLYASALISSIGADVNFEMCARGSENCSLHSIIFEARAGYPRLSISSCASVKFAGYYHDLITSTAHPGALYFYKNATGELNQADMIRSYVGASYNSFLEIDKCKVHGSTTSASSLQAQYNSSIKITGSDFEGTDGYAILIEKGSKVYLDTTTVIGTQGEVLVGGIATTVAARPFINITTDISGLIDFADYL